MTFIFYTILGHVNRTDTDLRCGWKAGVKAVPNLLEC